MDIVNSGDQMEKKAALYVKDGDDLFLIILDTATKKEISRNIIPVMTFEQVAKFGIANHRCGATEQIGIVGE